jgi:uroporphyrinogen decarboxylase
MTGREIILKALKNEETSRPAWLPFVGVHGAQLLGVTATEYLQSSDLIHQGLMKAYELYTPDALPVVFDLQVEAEVLGCELMWADEDPPSVVSNPLQLGVSDFPEFSTEAGRFPVIADATRRVKASIGDEAAVYGLITGPFTLGMHLAGQMIFLEMYDNPEAINDLMDKCADVAIKTAQFYIDNGADVVAVVDPMVSQIGADHFDVFVAPALNKVFDAIKEAGGMSSLFVCGDATGNLPSMGQTHCDNISVDENISLEYLREIADHSNTSVGGNMKLTTVLLLGDENDAKEEALRCMDSMGTKGYVLSPGCDLPWGVPPENLQAVAEVVLDEYKRDVARTTLKTAKHDTFEDVELPDYDSLDHLLVEVFTLDSAACPPCKYMVEAAEKAAHFFDGKVKVEEIKIKDRTGIGRMSRLGVEHIPTICVNGKTVFSSRIPDQPRLINALKTALEESDQQ